MSQPLRGRAWWFPWRGSVGGGSLVEVEMSTYQTNQWSLVKPKKKTDCKYIDDKIRACALSKVDLLTVFILHLFLSNLSDWIFWCWAQSQRGWLVLFLVFLCKKKKSIFIHIFFGFTWEKTGFLANHCECECRHANILTMMTLSLRVSPLPLSPLPRRQEEQCPRGLWHRHGEPRDWEGRRGHPVAVQEIPEKEAGREVLERGAVAASPPDVGLVLHVNQTAPSWTEKLGLGWGWVSWRWRSGVGSSWVN